MKAMVLKQNKVLQQGQDSLTYMEMPLPSPGPRELLLKVSVCDVCHTELDQIEGRIIATKLPMIPGHQVIGRVVEQGKGCVTYRIGERVGVAWIFSACGHCRYCASGLENLCHNFKATGVDAPGGYAEYMVVSEAFAHRIPDGLTDGEAAPLLCAGAIGFRSYRLSGIRDGQRLGLTGFGASGHLVLQLVQYLHPGLEVYVFARKEKERQFALSLGATWAGEIQQACPEKLDVIIDTTPAWAPVVEALAHLVHGGRLIINAIRKESHDKAYLNKLSYPQHIWMEKEIKSVANITRADVVEFLALAEGAGFRPTVVYYPLKEANKALLDLKMKHVRGAKVLQMA